MSAFKAKKTYQEDHTCNGITKTANTQIVNHIKYRKTNWLTISAVALLMASSFGKHDLLLCKKGRGKMAQENLTIFQSLFSLYINCI